jgi:hypothetical protein
MEKFDQMSNDSRGELCQNENYMDAIRLIQEDINRRCRNQFSYPIMELPFMQIVFASARDTEA